MNGASSEESPDSTQRIDSFNDEQRVYFVPLRWWKDAQHSMPSESVEKKEILYTATTGSSYGGPMKLINNIFNSDILFDLRREGDALPSGETGEANVSGRDFALVSSDMWLQALKWYMLFNLYIYEGLFHSCLFNQQTGNLSSITSLSDSSMELFLFTASVHSFEVEYMKERLR